MRRRLLTGAGSDAFWRHVQKSDGCWEWTGTRRPDGYGVMYLTNQQVRAHRVAWELTNGPIPDRLNVCHQCDNPPCVRPDHLYLGDQKRNIGDAVARGRTRKGKDHHLSKIDQNGEKNRRAKLTAPQVLAIRRLYLSGVSKHVIAPLYDIHPNSINRLVSGRRWSHLPGMTHVQKAHSGKRI